MTLFNFPLDLFSYLLFTKGFCIYICLLLYISVYHSGRFVTVLTKSTVEEGMCVMYVVGISIAHA